MKLLITGICGFVGSTLALSIREREPSIILTGIDNFSRSGSWLNKERLRDRGIEVVQATFDSPATSMLCQLPIT